MEGEGLIANFVRESWQDKENEEDREIEEIKGNGGPDVGGGSHEMGNRLFHPGSGDLGDPGCIEGEEGDERFDKDFDEHRLMIADGGGGGTRTHASLATQKISDLSQWPLCDASR